MYKEMVLTHFNNSVSMYRQVMTMTILHQHKYVYAIDVTGFWNTKQIVTLGLFHFTGPANGYTHTLPIHSAITRLD